MSFFFFFNDTATTEIYTLSLHDALPIWQDRRAVRHDQCSHARLRRGTGDRAGRADTLRGRRIRRGPSLLFDFPVGTRDRKSTRLNSSHLVISYAVFCLKKKRTASSRSAR